MPWPLNDHENIFGGVQRRLRPLAIYRSAKRVAKDQRFSDAGRQRRVAELDDELLALCSPRWLGEGQEAEGVEGDYRRLVNEIMRLMLVQELFVFVTTDGVEGNNNGSERELRDDAQRRDTGRTNKTPKGAKRQAIITSVLRTLGRYQNRGANRHHFDS